MAESPRPSHAIETPAEEPSLIDGARVREVLGLVWRAPRRHRALAGSVLALGLAVAALVAFWLPRTYEVDTKIAARRVLVMPSLGNPRRSVPTDSDAPTRGAADTIFDHENIVSIVEESNLLARWDAERPRILRWKDDVLRLVLPPPTKEDRQRALIGLLKRRMAVQADEATIKITSQWTDPGVAFDLVALAERNFLQRRSAEETAVISETITILEAEAVKDREALAAALAEAAEVAARTNAPRAAATEKPAATAPETRTVVVVRPAPLGRASSERVATASALAKELDDKRAEIRAVEEPWQRNLADLRAKLEDMKQSYAGAHPAVMTLERRIADASVEPKELSDLRAQEKALLDKIDAIPSGTAPRPTTTTTTMTVARPATSATGSPVIESPLLIREETPELAEARAKLTAASRKYEERADRIDAARIELETARAAFKYRYRIVEPPELPKDPLGPNRGVRFGVGIGLAVLLAFFAASARDLLGGRLVEGWQARRRLKIPLLGEVVEP